MAKVTQPLFSEKASGDLGSTIQFVCGHFLRKKPRTKDKKSKLQSDQRNKFEEGVVIWAEDLSNEQKQEWKRFKQAILLFPQCVKTVYTLSGYNLWMSYYMKFGVDGWDNYPLPPF